MALMAKIWTWATLVGGEWPTTATHAFACRFFGFSYFSTSLIVLIRSTTGRSGNTHCLLLWTC